MQGFYKTTLILLLVSGSLCASAAKDADNVPPSLMSCEQVLSTSSSDFIKKYTQVSGDSVLETTKAIYQYDRCYAEFLDKIHDQLNKTDKYPLMGAKAQFKDFETATNHFVSTVLGLCGPDPLQKRLREAYASLYQKQFRYFFYQQYLPEGQVVATNPSAIKAAKDKMDEIINHLPKDQRSKVSKAYTAYADAGLKGLKLPAQRVYEYAIMLFQSPSEESYSPPPL